MDREIWFCLYFLLLEDLDELRDLADLLENSENILSCLSFPFEMQKFVILSLILVTRRAWPVEKLMIFSATD